MAKASDFKFGTELGFAKSHYKITPKDKNVPGRRGDFPNIWGSL